MSDRPNATTLPQDLPVRYRRFGKLSYGELVAMLAALMAMNAAAIDVYIPALQSIGDTLGVTDINRRQFIISAYLIGFGAAQIVYGPLSDRFGRKPILYAGLGIYIVAAGAAMIAPTFEVLLLLRLVEGVGAAATRVMAVAIARDCFQGRQMAKVMSLVLTVFLVMPIFAPNIGAAIMVYSDWHGLSLFLFLFGLSVLVWVALRLPETLADENRRPLRARPVLAAFRMVVTNRSAFAYTIATGLIFASLFAFISQAEQIYTGIYGLGAAFTLYFSMIAIFMSASSFTNSTLVERFGMRMLSHGALVGYFVVNLLHLALAAWFGGATPLWLFMGLMVPAFCLFGFIGTNFNALAMEPLGKVAGTASSVLGSMQTLGGSIIGGVVGYLYDGSLIPLLAGFTLLALGALVATWIAEGGQLFRETADGAG